MKQLRNIVAPIFLLCLMAVASLPALAQEQQEDVTPQEQKENTVNVKEIVFGPVSYTHLVSELEVSGVWVMRGVSAPFGRKPLTAFASPL